MSARKSSQVHVKCLKRFKLVVLLKVQEVTAVQSDVLWEKTRFSSFWQ